MHDACESLTSCKNVERAKSDKSAAISGSIPVPGIGGVKA